MKSIKEKAIEYSSGYMNLDRQLVAKQAFETGANYMLEEVKILLNSQRFVDNPSQELFELIKQLKK